MRFTSFEQMLSHQAAAIPDQIALRFGSKGASCTYQELYRTVLEEAVVWRNSGKTCLGVFCDGSFDCVKTILAANLAGLQLVLLDENAPDALPFMT